MAVFGLPVAHEDDPERAVRAAMAMRERLQALNGVLLTSRGVALEIRIGINTGEVVANPRAAAGGQFMVTGDAVNVAARLRAGVDPGVTVVGERTYWNTARLADYRALPPSTLKGKTEPVKSWALIGLSPESSPRGLRGFRAPLIGREEEYALLQGTLQRVIRERRPHLITVIGQPGVGKTRLFEEFQASLPSSVIHRQGRSLPYGGTSLWALAEIIRAECGILRSDPVQVMIQKVRQRIAEFMDGEAEVDEAREMAAQLARILALRGDGIEATRKESREDLFWGLRGYFERLARVAPVILAFEDLHWGDTELLDFVEYLAQWAAGAVLVFCLARPELLETRPGWGGGKRNYTSLFLEALATDDIRRLLQGLLRVEVLPDTILHAASVAEGNPLFVEEILRMLMETGALHRVDGHWEIAATLTLAVPDTVQGVVAARLDRLGLEEKSILQDASTLGKVFWTGALAHLTGKSAAALVPTLRALQVKDFLVERERSQLAGQREFTFKHLIIRDTAYTMVPKSSRADKHRAFGTWLEQTYGTRAREFADLLAHHWLQAVRLAREVGLPVRGEDLEKAIHYTLEAAGKAMGLCVYEEAVRHYQHAIELLEEAGDERRLAETLLAMGEPFIYLDRTGSAVEVYQRAQRWYEDSGTMQDVARVHRLIGRALQRHWEFAEAIPHLERALQVLQPEEQAAQVMQIHLDLARAKTFSGLLDEAEQHALQALALAKAGGAVLMEAAAYTARGLIAEHRIAVDEAMAHNAEAVRLARRVEDPEASFTLGRSLNNMALAHQFRGEWEQALPLLQEALEISQKAGDMQQTAFLSRRLAIHHIWQGDWRAAKGYATAVLRMPLSPLYLRHAEALLRLLEGDLEGAVLLSRESLESEHRAGNLQGIFNQNAFVAWHSLELGRVREARDAAAEAGGIAERSPHYLLFPWISFVLEGLARGGDHERSQALSVKGETVSRAAKSWPGLAGALFGRAVLALEHGDPDDAIGLLEEALEAARRTGPLHHAYFLRTLAQALKRRGHPGDLERARTTLQECLLLLERMGDPRTAQLVRADLTSLRDVC